MKFVFMMIICALIGALTTSLDYGYTDGLVGVSINLVCVTIINALYWISE